MDWTQEKATMELAGRLGTLHVRCTWAEVHAFLSVFGSLRNLEPHFNVAPTGPVERHGPNGMVQPDHGTRRES